jgi:hypothetical protein
MRTFFFFFLLINYFVNFYFFLHITCTEQDKHITSVNDSYCYIFFIIAGRSNKRGTTVQQIITKRMIFFRFEQ